MGNELSAPHEGPTEVLGGRDVPSIARYLVSKKCRKVFVMLGAGVSTAAGIPDFRSPGTGLYSNLQRLDLPYPEAVFEINYFRQNPLPFYTLAHELYPGRFRPTLTHTFVKLLADHALLDTCFTQNIDTLERQANVPAHRIVEAHGSFAEQHCIECHSAFDGAKMKEAVENGEIVRCAQCDGLVKPDIVFFGESLPPLFQQTVPKLRGADLLLVIGTSLKVHPFASLTGLVPESCPRVLINMEPAGDIGTRPEDVVLLGRCDEIVRELARELGWEAELDREWAKTEILVPLDTLKKTKTGKEDGLVEKQTPEDTGPSVATPEVRAPSDGEGEVETLTERIGKALELSEVDALPKTEGIALTSAPEKPGAAAETEKAEEGSQGQPGKGAEEGTAKEKEKL